MVNVAGVIVLILMLSLEGVLPSGAGTSLVRLAETLDARDTTTLFLSAVGALITLMTWIVEGNSAACSSSL